MAREAKVRIDELLEQATEKLQKAIEIADKNGVDFEWKGPTDLWEEDLGMGGTYNAGSIWEASGSCEWEESGENTPGTWEQGTGSWNSSSANC